MYIYTDALTAAETFQIHSHGGNNCGWGSSCNYPKGELYIGSKTLSSNFILPKLDVSGGFGGYPGGGSGGSGKININAGSKDTGTIIVRNVSLSSGDGVGCCSISTIYNITGATVTQDGTVTINGCGSTVSSGGPAYATVFSSAIVFNNPFNFQGNSESARLYIDSETIEINEPVYVSGAPFITFLYELLNIKDMNPDLVNAGGNLINSPNIKLISVGGGSTTSPENYFNSEPTILNLQGFVKDKSTGFPLVSGSIELKIIEGTTTIWGPYTYDSIINNGVLQHDMGSINTLSLVPNKIYTLNVTVSDQNPYSCPRCNTFSFEFAG
ncbi:MAG: hypothetical protein KAI53_00245 [Candidatus Aenigmarchaeota archaeon]|nr:hypothetical protein [Candidatus Aenigmarchaeota archaeon]